MLKAINPKFIYRKNIHRKQSQEKVTGKISYIYEKDHRINIQLAISCSSRSLNDACVFIRVCFS
jgi:hypothetical protein